MNNPEALQRRLISLLVVMVCLGALWVIIVILNGDQFDETGAQVVVTAVAVALYLLIGVAGQSLASTRGDLAWFGWLTALIAGAGFVSAFLAIWSDWAGDGDDFWQSAAVMLALSAALGHTCLLLRGARSEDTEAVRLVRVGTIGAVFLLALLLSIEVTSDGEDLGPRGLGVVAVIYMLGTVLMPLTRRLTADGSRSAAPTPGASMSTRFPSGQRAVIEERTTDALIRPAYASDAEAIATIYNQGIEDRQATFQTRLHEPAELELKIEQRGGQLMVAERDGEVVGWAGWAGYDDPADYYAGIGECAVYVGREARGQGVGAELLEGMAAEAPKAGLHKLVAKIFTTNAASVTLFRRCGFREVGTHVRHGRLDGEWMDVIVMERLLEDL